MMPTEPVYALFSGGKDSFATAMVLKEAGLLAGCVLLDTGISVPEWRPGCEALCATHGFAYEVFRTNISYEWFVWKYGFPGPAGHGYAMNYLKGRAIREFKKAHPMASLASGVRRLESARRALNAKELGSFEGVAVYAPIFDWTTERVWAYVRAHGYERPKSYLTLGISGDCLCGAFAQDHERSALADYYPLCHARIQALETEIATHHPTRCRWGAGSTAQAREEQTNDEAIICVECSQGRTLHPRVDEWPSVFD